MSDGHVKRNGTEARSLFAHRYRADRADVHAQVEQAVLGSAFGANGYTTRAEADRLAELLHLNDVSRLLDLGSGRGWPGLYLAERSGCRVVLADLPEEGLRTALARTSDQSGVRASAVVAAGASLPIRQRSFDAVVHTDVTC